MAARLTSELISELNALRARLPIAGDSQPADGEGRPLGSSAPELLEQAASQLNRLEGGLLRVERQIKLVNYLDELLQTCNTPEEAYPKIAEVASAQFDGQLGSLSILHPPGHYLETMASWGERILSHPIFAANDCWALQRGQPYEVADPQTAVTCRHFILTPENGYLCVPLVVKGKPLGLLSLSFPDASIQADQRPWQALAMLLANVAKLTLSNLALSEELYEQSIHDPLTGLFNRKYVEETLPRELHRTTRTHLPLCVASVDIDHFRRFNNIFGHEAGDMVLKEVGRMLNESLRKSDIVARYGADQFLLIFPDAKAEDTRDRLEEINVHAKELKFKVEEQTIGGVSLSAGIVQSPENGVPADKLIQWADRALQVSKQTGRDRATIYKEED